MNCRRFDTNNTQLLTPKVFSQILCSMKQLSWSYLNYFCVQNVFCFQVHTAVWAILGTVSRRVASSSTSKINLLPLTSWQNIFLVSFPNISHTWYKICTLYIVVSPDGNTLDTCIYRMPAEKIRLSIGHASVDYPSLDENHKDIWPSCWPCYQYYLYWEWSSFEQLSYTTYFFQWPLDLP